VNFGPELQAHWVQLLHWTRWKSIANCRSVRVSAGKRVCDLDLWTRDLENLTGSWSDCRKYLCTFWFKSLQWFSSSCSRDFCVYRRSTFDLWPLTLTFDLPFSILSMSCGAGSD